MRTFNASSKLEFSTFKVWHNGGPIQGPLKPPSTIVT